MNNANVKASTGDTVVLGWQYDLNADIRKETLEIFYCGYRDKIGKKHCNDFEFKAIKLTSILL